jgi:hypothetical protein
MKYNDIYESMIYYVIYRAYISLHVIMWQYVTKPPVFQVNIPWGFKSYKKLSFRRVVSKVSKTSCPLFFKAQKTIFRNVGKH